ncbi:MAG: TfuA-like protein [Pseudomonadota bacterium]
MTDHIFVGPSLAGSERLDLISAQWHPPAQGGDLLALDLGADDRVCLIDGVFEAAPAVRHKEILLLLSEGVPVFGASSMGALRAAELQQFGMKGTGRIHAAFASGAFTRDDWVALRHAPVELGCQPLTVALVDLIFGLQHAVRQHMLSAKQGNSLLRAGATLFYQDRDWPAIERASSLSDMELEPFRKWRTKSWFSQKTRDALNCLNLMNNHVQKDRCRPDFVDTPFLRQFASASGNDSIKLGPRSGDQNILQQS